MLSTADRFEGVALHAVGGVDAKRQRAAALHDAGATDQLLVGFIHIRTGGGGD
jgi:hypothetical protein